MRTWVLAAIALAWPCAARAQSRVSIEVGGAFSGYDLATGSGHVALTSTNLSAVDSVQRTPQMGHGIGAFEVRPTVVLERGLLFGVGFREGTAGLGSGSTNLVGGDVALGYAHRFGRFLPFVKGEFGFNTYDALDGNMAIPRRTDLRLDAVLGSRLYVWRRVYVAASAFGGWGDLYGGSFAVGGDVLQFVSRGQLP